MKLGKYVNDGWGISQMGFEKIFEIFKSIDFSKYEKYNIVEFGSGISTHFFVDYIEENNLKNAQVISFENDAFYATKAKHSQLDLKMRKLITCSDNDYTYMFNLKEYDQYKVVPNNKDPDSRQKNCFYDIQNDDIPDNVNFVLLDGPSGNGRNFAFLHLKNKLHTGSIVFIDDYNHYDFVDKFKSVFNSKEIFKHTSEHDNFIILEII